MLSRGFSSIGRGIRRNYGRIFLNVKIDWAHHWLQHNPSLRRTSSRTSFVACHQLRRRLERALLKLVPASSECSLLCDPRGTRKQGSSSWGWTRHDHSPRPQYRLSQWKYIKRHLKRNHIIYKKLVESCFVLRTIDVRYAHAYRWNDQ